MEKTKRVLLLGYLGYINNQIDGQTIKTRLVKEILESSFKNFRYIDTQILKSKPYYLLKIILNCLKSEKIIIMPGQNGLKIIFPIVYLISKIKNIDIYYVVVGGWLVEFLKKEKILKKMLKKIKGIYLEIPQLKTDMKKLGFDNCNVLYNFRKIENFNRKKMKDKINNEFKLVFYSRVMEEKGILDLLNAMKGLEEVSISLDIYGPIKKDFEAEFYKEIKKNKKISYKGILLKDKIDTLSYYDLMVFPTYYQGEGFAGVIIDSYIAEVPILASDWKYNKDFILDDKTGKLYKVRDINDLKNKLLYFYKNTKVIHEMKISIRKEIKKYSYEIAKKILVEEIK